MPDERQHLASEAGATTPPSVYSGLGYPMDRKEVSPEPTGWQASGPHSNTPGSKGLFEKVSRETYR